MADKWKLAVVTFEEFKEIWEHLQPAERYNLEQEGIFGCPIPIVETLVIVDPEQTTADEVLREIKFFHKNTAR
jgi:hypothetical protein